MKWLLIPSHDSMIENSLLMVLSDAQARIFPSPSRARRLAIRTASLILEAFDDLVPQNVERDFFLDGDPF
jgi:hypothetical protein